MQVTYLYATICTSLHRINKLHTADCGEYKITAYPLANPSKYLKYLDQDAKPFYCSLNMKSGQIHQNILNMGMNVRELRICINILYILKDCRRICDDFVPLSAVAWVNFAEMETVLPKSAVGAARSRTVPWLRSESENWKKCPNTVGHWGLHLVTRSLVFLCCESSIHL